MNQNNNFLAKWLNNELDEQTLNEFEKTSEFKEYSQIVEALDAVVVPNYDVEANYKATLQKIKEQKETKNIAKKPKVRRLIPVWAYAVASCLVLFVGVYFYFFQQTTYSTQLAQKKVFELPDGSKAHLNADSEITFRTYGWTQNKEVKLKGEAFFDVEKGKSFIVIAKQGTVEVLGTAFSVKDRKSQFSVVCFTGKVLVKTPQKEPVTLAKGQALSVKNQKLKRFQTNAESPSWTNNESTFSSVDIKEVVEELELQYNITIKGKENLKSANFSGRFPHDNINKAVKTVFKAMQVPYRVDKEGNIVIKKY